MATLTTTISESITLNGQIYDSLSTKSLTNITQVIKAQFEASTTSGDIITFGDAGAGYTTIDRDQVRYLRITNLDGTNFVTLGFEDTSGNNAYFVNLDAGRSYVVAVPDDNNDSDFAHPSFFAIDNAHAVSTFVDIVTITADADTAACNLEVFIALDTTSD